MKLPIIHPSKSPSVFALLLIAMVVLGFGSAFAGFYHTVRPGDSLTSIAGKYGVSTAMIKMSNQLSDSPTLAAGTKLWIEGRAASPPPRSSYPAPRSRVTPYPGRSTAPTIHKAPPRTSTHFLSLSTKTSLPKSYPRSSAPPPRATAPTPIPDSQPAPAPRTSKRATRPSDLEDPKDDSPLVDVPGGGQAVAPPPPPTVSSPTGSSIRPSKSGFIWPVEGRVTKRFTSRADEKYAGIDISVPRGTEVRAAADGKVMYADDRIRAYGRMAVIQHANGFSTCYGQTSQLLVHEGQMVSRGQIIARSGDSGRGGEAYLHFEMRKNRTAVNPEPYLP